MEAFLAQGGLASRVPPPRHDPDRRGVSVARARSWSRRSPGAHTAWLGHLSSPGGGAGPWGPIGRRSRPPSPSADRHGTGSGALGGPGRRVGRGSPRRARRGLTWRPPSSRASGRHWPRLGGAVVSRRRRVSPICAPAGRRPGSCPPRPRLPRAPRARPAHAPVRPADGLALGRLTGPRAPHARDARVRPPPHACRPAADRGSPPR